VAVKIHVRLVPQSAIETLAVLGLRTSGLEVQRLRSYLLQPLLSSFGTNSSPVSDRMYSGIPYTNITYATSITSQLPNRRATRAAKHFRVHSSIHSRIRNIIRPVAHRRAIV